MRVWTAWLAAVLFGSAVGAGLAAWVHWNQRVDFGPMHWEVGDSSTAPLAKGKVPKVVVVGPEEHNFGSMPRDATRSHSFVVRNDGDAPLSLTIADTTCQCTVGKLEQDQVPPGGSTQVTLTWSANSYEREFRQSATLRTNDPARPSIILSVTGNIMQLIRPQPISLALSQVSRNETRETRVRIFAYRDEDLEVTNLTLDDPATAEHFDVQTEPLSDEEIRAEPGAVGGVALKVRLLPGLPLGPIRQSVRMEFSKEDVAPLSIPIDANIISDVSIVAGDGLDRDRNLLRLGQVPRSQGKSATVHVLVKGPNREQIELSVAETDPEGVLTASFGEPRRINNAMTLLYPLKIEVPAGAQLVSRLGSGEGELGRVVIRMTGTDSNELALSVSFVVVEN